MYLSRKCVFHSLKIRHPWRAWDYRSRLAVIAGTHSPGGWLAGRWHNTRGSSGHRECPGCCSGCRNPAGEGGWGTWGTVVGGKCTPWPRLNQHWHELAPANAISQVGVSQDTRLWPSALRLVLLRPRLNLNTDLPCPLCSSTTRGPRTPRVPTIQLWLTLQVD